MRILYIADFLYFTAGGAKVSAYAHMKTLVELYGKKSIDIIALTGQRDDKSKYGEIEIIRGERNKIKLFFNCLLGYTTYLDKAGIKTILKYIEKKEYHVVFIDNSIFGNLVRNIKLEFPKVPVITYYHDVKASLALDWKRKASLLKKPVYQAMIKNERVNQKYSDVNLTLNPRENNLFKKAYGRDSELQLGVYMDVYLSESYKNSDEILSTPIQLLFNGSHYLPNVKGILWFIDHVLPILSIEVVLVIAGSQMEKLNNEIIKIPSNVKIFGFIEDLSALYEKTDVVISPIFEGGGMKVKIAHASSYGKIVIGTDESFEGYQENISMEQWDKYFYRCNTAQEFAQAIEKVSKDKTLRKMNKPIRNYFENYYSSNYASNTIKTAVEMAIKKVKND